MSSDDELPQELSDQSDEEEDEDEEEEEEEDEEDGPRKKRKTKGYTGAEYFFDEEAEDADDSEEEIEAEEGYEEIAVDVMDSQTRANIYNKPRILDDRDEHIKLQEQAKRFEANYKGYDEDEDDDEEEDENSHISLKKNLPTPNGPKLWMIKCKHGKEKKAVAQILKKCIEKEETEPSQILSAICSDHLKGYIYVEAKKPAHVKNILNGIRIFPQNVKLALVPLQEMPEVLKAAKEQITVEKDGFVRIKRGLYKKDLAQVVEVLESQSKVIVKLIPRLDLTNSDDSNTAKRKRNQRMPARFFNYEEVRAIVGNQVTPKREKNGELCYIYNKDKFKNGFVYKTVNLKTLDTVNIIPTIEEMQRFQEREDSEESFTAPLPIRNSSKKETHFSKGDVVVVLEGELKTLRGVVENVRGTLVEIRPQYEGFSDLLPIDASSLRKCFMDGDHVKVIAGVHEGETGLIVKVEDNVVMIFSDVTNKVLQVLSSDIQDCSDVNPTRFSIGEYELHDMVALTNSNSTGVIVKVDKDTCQVMETNGNIKTIGVQEIKFKRKDGESYDKTSANIKVSDVVLVLDGKYKGKQGTIKHVFRTHVYIYSRGILENSGIFVVRSTSCRKLEGNVGQNRPKASFGNPNLGLASPSHSGEAQQREGTGRGTVIPRFRKVKDPLLHKTVKVKSGVWKGYMGMVVDVTSSDYRIELHTKNKTVNIPIRQVEVVEENKQNFSGSDYFSASGNATPMHLGSRTPIRGDRTPLRGDRTPVRSGDRTPSRGGDRTPSHDGSRTPSHDNIRTDDYDRVGTPSYPQLSPYSPYASGTPGDSGYSGFSVDTPSFSSTPRSLESPYSITPQSFPATPSISSMNPQTPGTPSADFHYISDDMSSNGLSVDIEVKINEGISGGQYRGETAAIREIKNYDCIVELLKSRKKVSIPIIYLEAVLPSQSDRVKVLRGEHQGVIGYLKQIDQVEHLAVVQAPDDMVMVPYQNVAKYVSP